MALASPDHAWCLAWSEPRYGLVIFCGARPAAALQKGPLPSTPADCPGARAGYRPGCPARLRGRCCDPVPMASDWRCNDPIRYWDLETLACAAPHLGRHACQFLGSDHLVMVDGKRTRGRAHGCAGPSRRKIGVLRSDAIQH